MIVDEQPPFQSHVSWTSRVQTLLAREHPLPPLESPRSIEQRVLHSRQPDRRLAFNATRTNRPPLGAPRASYFDGDHVGAGREAHVASKCPAR
jgi:hypothetical protein